MNGVFLKQALRVYHLEVEIIIMKNGSLELQRKKFLESIQQVFRAFDASIVSRVLGIVVLDLSDEKMVFRRWEMSKNKSLVVPL